MFKNEKFVTRFRFSRVTFYVRKKKKISFEELINIVRFRYFARNLKNSRARIWKGKERGDLRGKRVSRKEISTGCTVVVIGVNIGNSNSSYSNIFIMRESICQLRLFCDFDQFAIDEFG